MCRNSERERAASKKAPTQAQKTIESLDDYKAVSLHGIRCDAWFQENQALLESVNSQPLAPVVSCIGDGHPVVWKIVTGIRQPQQRREVLDWFHLMENLHKVGGSEQRLKQVRLDLWQGQVAAAKAAFDDWEQPPAPVVNFLNYVAQHQARIPNYQSDQQQGLCIGSGAVESTIKRIGVRIKISGAQWKSENVGRVLTCYSSRNFSRPLLQKKSATQPKVQKYLSLYLVRIELKLMKWFARRSRLAAALIKNHLTWVLCTNMDSKI